MPQNHLMDGQLVCRTLCVEEQETVVLEQLKCPTKESQSRPQPHGLKPPWTSLSSLSAFRHHIWMHHVHVLGTDLRLLHVLPSE